MAKTSYRPDEITYELFGIDPAEFYRTKFALGVGLGDALANTVFRYEIAFEKIRLLIADLRTGLPNGGRVLDIGCGAGTYGPTLLSNVSGLRLYGVDLSDECLEQAAANGYTHCQVADLREPLPYDDGAFDAVFSMDTLGHIEFRSKAALIDEMARTTAAGGFGHHGVETADVDYFQCEPTDPTDAVRRYVHLEGHIGVEPARRVAERFATRFSHVSWRPTFVKPFATKDEFAAFFEPDFRDLVDLHGQPESVQLTNIILGRLNQHFVATYERLFGDAVGSSGEKEVNEDVRARAQADLQRRIDDYNTTFGVEFVSVPRELFEPEGFTSFTLKKSSR